MRDRRLQDVAIDTHLIAALQIVRDWSAEAEDKGIENKQLSALKTSIVNANIYIASLRLERDGFDMAIDGANKYAKQMHNEMLKMEEELQELKNRIKLYEL